MVNIKRKYVIPGDLICEGNYSPLANVMKIGNRFYSTRVGMAEISREGVKVIPLSGIYIPRVDDIVIGKIIDYSAFAWEVDINSCFSAYLPAQSVFGKDFSPAKDSLVKKFDIGDLIVGKIVAFDRTRDPLLSVSGPGLGKVSKGEIIRIAPSKVPRLIGKKGSMIKAIENYTKCKLNIGQNGLIIATGPPEGILLAIKAIRLIEEEAHIADLTKKVQKLLEEGGSVGKVDR
ncbi:MAG: exosome complex RNA-binding protein Rrp4 [Nitrososphaerales archaeon]|nr:exosome complex RNA-binding protein Rrp4 [Nitrososphaerales archaeon]